MDKVIDLFDVYGYTATGFIKIYYKLGERERHLAVHMYRSFREKILNNEISSILNELGIAGHLLSYFYIQEIMKESAHDVRRRPRGELYLILAKRFHTTQSSIDRSIRNAIDYIHKNGKDESLYKVCGVKDLGRKCRIANVEMLSGIHQELIKRMAIADHLTNSMDECLS